MNIRELSKKAGVYIDADDVEKFGHLTASIEQVNYRIYVTLPDRKVIGLHRLILDAPKDKWVDHKDNNPCNNRKANLRLATSQQNSYNRGKNSNNTSGYKGVSRVNSKWKASIMVSGKNISLGYYLNIISAAKAYDKAALKYNGEFAKGNFI